MLNDLLHFDFASILTKLGFSRDDLIWFWGKFVGVVMFLATLGADQLHMTYGLSERVIHIIMLLSAWLALFSAQNSTSKLFGEGQLPKK